MSSTMIVPCGETRFISAFARALGIDASTLVLDEPTASLPEDEVKILFDALRGLQSSGIAMTYVSHRLDGFARFPKG